MLPWLHATNSYKEVADIEVSSVLLVDYLEAI